MMSAKLAFGPDDASGLLKETGAVERCPEHPEIMIRIGDEEKEFLAYKLADERLRDLTDHERLAAKSQIAASLKCAADGFCVLCFPPPAVP
jgi:hypothetical protein